MTYLDRMMKGEDFTAEVKAGWGPETELGRPVELEINVSLYHNPRYTGYCLSITGILDIKKCDKLGLVPIKTGGQCKDMDRHLAACGLFSPTLDRIISIWRRWHLNDMCPGTEAQEKCLAGLYAEKCGTVSFDERCEYLKNHGLLCDPRVIVGGMPYKYGSGWLYRKIPHEVLRDLCVCLDTGITIMKGEKR